MIGRGKPIKLLIIEDEDDLRNVLEENLKEEGHTVESEGNGADGLLRALHFDYDLILLDVMLPEMDGWQILEKLREKKDTPVLMLTARDTSADRIRGLDLGSDDYVVKPFDLNELKARIRALLRRSGGGSSPVLKIAEGIEMDTNSRRVLKDGEDINLTAKELNLLEIFLQRPGHTIPRDKIAGLLFADQDEGDSNVIDVYIYNLRTKLGRGIIKTRRGVGYEIVKY